ncbi:Cyclin-dependent kinase 10 [Mortierella claussenii]|nr:Cyclin-dependent kinase 10 [Mortierella claussenii]
MIPETAATTTTNDISSVGVVPNIINKESSSRGSLSTANNISNGEKTSASAGKDKRDDVRKEEGRSSNSYRPGIDLHSGQAETSGGGPSDRQLSDVKAPPHASTASSRRGSDGGREHNRRSKEDGSEAGPLAAADLSNRAKNDQLSSSSLSGAARHQDRDSYSNGHRSDRSNRSQPTSINSNNIGRDRHDRDRPDNVTGSSSKHGQDGPERPIATGNDRDQGGGGGAAERERGNSVRDKEIKSSGVERDNRSRGQDQKHRDDRQLSQPSSRRNNNHSNNHNQGRDNRQPKDRERDKESRQQRDNQAKGGGASDRNGLEGGRPDPLSLLSITGRMGSLTPQKPFFGNSRIVDDFEKLNKVGEGTYGVVYRARDKKTGEVVALKRIRMERENDGLPISSLREIKLLKTLRHDNIVLVKDVAVGSDLDQIFLVMEYCEHDMAALMDNVKTPYTPAEVKCLMYQLLKGIEYCHDHYVIHRDLKLSNLLLSGQGILKIADFGLARSFGLPSRPMTPKVVTLWYRAPELLFGDTNYTTAVDMWSAGCIFGELLKHAPLLPGKVEKQQVDLIIELIGTPHEKIWQGFNKLPMSSIKLPEQRHNNLRNKFPNITDAARSLLSGLLTLDPKKRLSVKQALAHPYFIESPPAKHPSLLPTHPEIRNISSTRHEENAKLKRQAAGDETENSIGNNRKRVR